MIFGSPRLDPRLLEIHLNPTLRTLMVERVCHNWERSLPHSVRVWAEVDAYLDTLVLPAVQSVHVRLHDSVHGVCHCFECDGGELPTDHDQWKRQIEDAMPLLKGRGILGVEVVKRQLTF